MSEVRTSRHGEEIEQEKQVVENIQVGGDRKSESYGTTLISLPQLGITRDESSKKGHLKNNVAVQHLNSKRKDGKRASSRYPELDYSLCRNIYKWLEENIQIGTNQWVSDGSTPKLNDIGITRDESSKGAFEK